MLYKKPLAQIIPINTKRNKESRTYVMTPYLIRYILAVSCMLQMKIPTIAIKLRRQLAQQVRLYHPVSCHC